MIPIPAVFPGLLAADDDGFGSIVKILVFLGIIVVSIINSAIQKRRALAASRPDPDEVDEDGTGEDAADGTRAAVFDRARIPDEATVAVAARRASAAVPPALPRGGARPAGAAPKRRKGLLDDAHVDGASHLPTSDDLPGAHAAHDHVRLTEIGADRGTSPRHLGARPTAAATVGTARATSGHDLLRSTDLKGRNRVRAGILWAEVFGPPRSRSRARTRR